MNHHAACGGSYVLTQEPCSRARRSGGINGHCSCFFECSSDSSSTVPHVLVHPIGSRCTATPPSSSPAISSGGPIGSDRHGARYTYHKKISNKILQVYWFEVSEPPDKREAKWRNFSLRTRGWLDSGRQRTP